VSSEQNKIKDFTDLVAWQEAQKLLLMVYKVTKKFPKDELFSLTSQIRRAAVSVTSNIAEGFGRSSKKDKIHFYNIAHSSVDEIRSQLFAARDLGYIDEVTHTQVSQQAVKSLKIIIGLIRSIKD